MALLTLIIVAGDLDFSEDGHERLGLKRRPKYLKEETLSRVVLMTFTGGMWFKWDCEHNEKNMYLDFFRLSFRDFVESQEETVVEVSLDTSDHPKEDEQSSEVQGENEMALQKAAEQQDEDMLQLALL